MSPIALSAMAHLELETGAGAVGAGAVPARPRSRGQPGPSWRARHERVCPVSRTYPADAVRQSREPQAPQMKRAGSRPLFPICWSCPATRSADPCRSWAEPTTGPGCR
jgi:hypothetical protein